MWHNAIASKKIKKEPLMKNSTRKRAIEGMKESYGKDEMVKQMYRIILEGKKGFDKLLKELGKMAAETIMYIEREEIAGPDYRPLSTRKWASQEGSVYIGDQKIKVEHPRLRGTEGEISLKSYKKLRERGGFSEELLEKILSGISCRKYRETVVEAAEALGISASSVSRHIVEATTKQLEEFKARSLSVCHLQSFSIPYIVGERLLS